MSASLENPPFPVVFAPEVTTVLADLARNARQRRNDKAGQDAALVSVLLHGALLEFARKTPCLSRRSTSSVLRSERICLYEGIVIIDVVYIFSGTQFTIHSITFTPWDDNPPPIGPNPPPIGPPGGGAVRNNAVKLCGTVCGYDLRFENGGHVFDDNTMSTAAALPVNGISHCEDFFSAAVMVLLAGSVGAFAMHNHKTTARQEDHFDELEGRFNRACDPGMHRIIDTEIAPMPAITILSFDYCNAMTIIISGGTNTLTINASENVADFGNGDQVVSSSSTTTVDASGGSTAAAAIGYGNAVIFGGCGSLNVTGGGTAQTFNSNSLNAYGSGSNGVSKEDSTIFTTTPADNIVVTTASDTIMITLDNSAAMSFGGTGSAATLLVPSGGAFYPAGEGNGTLAVNECCTDNTLLGGIDISCQEIITGGSDTLIVGEGANRFTSLHGLADSADGLQATMSTTITEASYGIMEHEETSPMNETWKRLALTLSTGNSVIKAPGFFTFYDVGLSMTSSDTPILLITTSNRKGARGSLVGSEKARCTTTTLGGRMAKTKSFRGNNPTQEIPAGI